MATTWYHSLSVLLTENTVLVASEPPDPGTSPSPRSTPDLPNPTLNEEP